VLRRRGEHLSEVVDHNTALVGLGDEAPTFRKLSSARSDFSRDDEDQDPGPAAMNESGKIESVQAARHLNVSEDHPHVVAPFEPGESLIGVASLNDRSTGSSSTRRTTGRRLRCALFIVRERTFLLLIASSL
jgi:hypothetical protein